MNEQSPKDGREIDDLLRWGRACLALIALVVLMLAAQSNAMPGRTLSHRLLMTAERHVSGGDLGTGRLLARNVENPQAYATPGALFVARQITPPGDVVRSELQRLNPVTGQVLATRQLNSAFGQALLTSAGLWVTTTHQTTTRLWRLDPRSLAVELTEVLPGSGELDGTAGSMARAHGWLWVGTANALDRVSITTGQITAMVQIPGAAGVQVASDAAGGVLVVSEGHGSARVQRRDPDTGGLIAQSPTVLGVSKPYVDGIAHGGLWISSAGGMAGSVQRWALATLKPVGFAGAQPHPGVGGPPSILGTNAVSARVIDGVLWVTQPYGGPQRNYCGDPLTGRARAALHLPADAQLLTADNRSVYYVSGSARSSRVDLHRAPIAPACHRH